MSGIFDQIINYSPPLIVSGTVNYKGTWDASTNNPTLNNPPASSTKGDYYVVSTAGTQFTISFAVGDWIISSGTAWEKVDLTDAVSSVFGRTGAVVGVSTDYSSVGLTNTAIGAANPSSGAFTSLSSSSTTTLNGTTVPASKTLVVTTDKLSALASTTSSELAGVISDETGSGALVFGTSPTIATPVIAQINDANGNSTLRLTGITSATDYLEIKNGIGVGSPLHVLAEGASTNIGVHLQPKGSGLFTISDGTDFNKGIRFRSSSSAASAVTLIDAVSTAGRVVTLPDATGTLLYGGGPLGTPSSGTVTNLTGTASININGTVGGTTPTTVAATTITGSGSAIFGNSSTPSVSVAGIQINNPFSIGPSIFSQSSATTNRWIDFMGSSATLASFTNDSGVFSIQSGSGKANISTTGLAVTGALTTTGNVGVNVTSPAIKLVVSEGASIAPSIPALGAIGGTFAFLSDNNKYGLIGGTSNTGNTFLQVQRVDGTATAYNMLLQPSGGNVGIGTASPASKLDTAGTVRATSQTVPSSGTGAELFYDATNAGLRGYNRTGSAYVNLALNDNVYIGGGSSGNVGIGTSSPAAALHVLSGTDADDGNIKIESSGNTAGATFYSPSHASASSRNWGFFNNYNAAGYFELLVSTSKTNAPTVTLFRADTTGLAVTGTVSATADVKAAVYGYFGSSGVAPSATNPGFAFSNPLNVSAAGWSAGTATTSLTLVNVYNGNGIVGSVVTNGSTTAWNITSDARLKTNLRDITNSSAIIDALKPRRFDWLTVSQEKDDYGFVAQEAYEVYPKMVSVGGDDPAEKPWAVDPSKLIPILVAELQSVRQRLAALEA